LGVRFLKHVGRTRLLLHIVDILPPDESDPVEAINTIVKELQKFSPTLAQRERWLVLNKIDMLPEKERNSFCKKIVDRLNWKGKVFFISAASRIGTDALSKEVMNYIEARNQLEAEDENIKLAEEKMKLQLAEESRRSIEAVRAGRKDNDADENEDDDDHEVEVVIAPY